jgi:hypothetical protein
MGSASPDLFKDVMLKLVTKIFGSRQDRDLKQYWPQVKRIQEEFEKLSGLTDDQLRAKTEEFKKRIARKNRPTTSFTRRSPSPRKRAGAFADVPGTSWVTRSPGTWCPTTCSSSAEWS